MRIFVTGASGFIGSYLLRKIVKENHEILSLKREKTNLFRIKDSYPNLEWVNIEDKWEEKAIKFKPQVIINLAWFGVAANDRTDWDIQLENIGFQQKLLRLGAVCHIQKFVGIGSQAEYGAFESKIDEDYPTNPNTAYGAVKNASLILMKTYCEIHHIDWYWFRVFPCFGEMESDVWLIPSLIKKMSIGDSMDLTLGEQKLAYLYVEEVANAIASSINVEGKVGIYNISSNNPIPLKDLVIKIRNFVNPNFKLNFGALPYREGQSMYMEGNTDKLKTNLYQIQNSNFEEKLKQTITYYKERFQDGNI